MTGKGPNKQISTVPRLTVTIKGPKVGDARLSARDIADIVTRAQQALKRVGRVLYGEESKRRGRDKADIEQLCELFFVGWQTGSAKAELELGVPPPQMHLFGYIGENSLSAFVNGMSKVRDATATALNLPSGFDRGVLQTCDELSRVLDHGIDTITFEAGNGHARASFTLDSTLRARFRELLGQPVDVSSTVKTGRLEELNGHGALTGRFWEPDGTKWLCHFKQEHMEQLPEAWMRNVQIIGRAIVEEGKERILEIESLVILEAEMQPPHPPETVPFWKSVSLEELAEQQGVSSVSDIDEISALWPVDDDPDDLIRHILHEREARRTLPEGHSAT